MTANGAPPFDSMAGMVPIYGTAPVYGSADACEIVPAWPGTYVEPPPMPWPVSVPVSWPVVTRTRFVSKFSTRKRGAR